MGFSKRLFVLGLLTAAIYSGSAGASIHSPGDGREEAFQFCTTLTFSSSQDDCISHVRTSRFFNIAALASCGELNFDSEKVDCVRTIANRDYASFEVDYCKSKPFQSERMRCFATSGTLWGDSNYPPQYPSVAELRTRLSQAITDLRRGATSRADQNLSDLLNRLNH